MKMFTIVACAAVLAVSVAWADTPINESAPAAKDGTVIIKNVAGSVKITGTDKEEVAVTGTLGENVTRLEFVPSPTETLIRVHTPSHGHKVGPTHLNVSIPAGSRVNVETVSATVDGINIAGPVDAQSVSGDITLQGSMPRVDLETVSGKCLVRSTDVTVDAESVSGPLAVSADAGAVDMETVSGDAQVNVKSLRKGSFESVSGDFRLEGGVAPDAQVRVETFSGDVECALPPDASANVKFDSFSGKLDGGDFGMSGAKHFNGNIGNGAARITLDTFSGSAKLRNITVGGETRIRVESLSR